MSGFRADLTAEIGTGFERVFSIKSRENLIEIPCFGNEHMLQW